MRDPDRYAIWINATINGLRKIFDTAGGSKSGGRKSYLEFCDLVGQFRNKYDVAPQEVDAVLAKASRYGPREDSTSAPQLPQLADPSVEALASACSLPVEQVDEWVTLVQGAKRQAIFYGPPGTGKTYIARRLANHLAGDASRVRTIQFHPSYSYEDVVEGLRPELEESSGAQLSYVIRPGLFRELCIEAAAPALAFFDHVQEAVGRDSPFAPGHSYWMVDDPGAQELHRVWKYEIRPYLEEFWFESPGRVAELDAEIEQLIVEQS